MGVRIFIPLGATLLGALAYLILGVFSPNFLPFGGVVLTLVSYGLWKLRGVEAPSEMDRYAPAYIAAAGIVIGALGRWAIEIELKTKDFGDPTADLTNRLTDLLALLLSLLTSVIIVLATRRRAGDRCHRCQRALGGRPHRCPRGGEHWVCNQCWLAEKMRCKDCDELRTPLLTLEDDGWWAGRLGDKQRTGNCFNCRRSAAERDLWRCGRCPGAMCNRCWDLENGRCAKCAWIIPDLPQPLEEFEIEERERRAS